MLKSVIRRASIEDLIPYEKNPNQMNSVMKDSLNYSIKKHGMLQLPIIDQNNNIIDGHQRYNACIEQGIKEIDVIEVEIYSEKDKRLLSQALNKIHGTHNPELDAHDMISILKSGDDEAQNMLDLMRMTAQNDEREIFRLLESQNLDYSKNGNSITKNQIDKEEIIKSMRAENATLNNPLDEISISPEEISVPVTKYGDIWKLGRHRLLCGDFADSTLMCKLTENKKMDMVFVDPPYNIMGSSNGFTKMDDDNVIQPFFRNLLQLIRMVTKPNGHVYIFCNWRSYYPILYANTNIQLTPKNLIVWHKPDMRLGTMYSSSHELIIFMANQPIGKHLKDSDNPEIQVKTVYGETNVWVYNKGQGQTTRDHFAQKPIALSERAIKNSIDENETVMDMCLGSGTTLMAAEQLDRICYGVEINPKYCDIIINRWEKYTGQKAELIK